MNLKDLIQEYEKRINRNPKDISCLLFALQIPSICSRIEFPQTDENTGSGDDKLYNKNGKVRDKNMYKKWLNKHTSWFSNIYSDSMTKNAFSENLYKLRNQFTHEGILMTENSNFYFTDGDPGMVCGDMVFLPIKQLCLDMFLAAYKSLSLCHKSVSITPFESLFIPKENYYKICTDFSILYDSFWKKRQNSKEDNVLYIIYNHAIFDNPSMENEINNFFAKNPDGTFKIWDFDRRFGSIMGIDKKFKYNDDKGIGGICFNKEQYENMLQVVKDLKDLSDAHPFDITKYK